MAAGTWGFATPASEAEPGADGASAAGICEAAGFDGSTAAARTAETDKAAGPACIAGLTKAAAGITEPAKGAGAAIGERPGARSPAERPDTDKVSGTRGELELREPAWPPTDGTLWIGTLSMTPAKATCAAEPGDNKTRTAQTKLATSFFAVPFTQGL